MKSSNGEHYVALDHVRALAAFLVFSWHFTHTTNGTPISFRYTPSLFLFAPLDEGHTGVSLFMVLSGYLFATLLIGRRIEFVGFVWNRFLRLAPLLIVVLAVVGFQRIQAGDRVADYLRFVRDGLFFPTLPNGGWSITVEFHFYLLLPILLWLLAKSRHSLLVLILAAVGFRFWYWQTYGDVQGLAYFTLVGHIDQFLFGMLATQWRGRLANRHLLAASLFVAFAMFYWRFDLHGGFYGTRGSSMWVWLPTLEGLVYAALVGWYDSSFKLPATRLSGLVAKIGAYSYSIYLLHFFVVFGAARLIHERVMPLNNFYVAAGWSLATFVGVMLPIGHLSHHLIERPFLKLRRSYLAPIPSPLRESSFESQASGA